LAIWTSAFDASFTPAEAGRKFRHRERNDPIIATVGTGRALTELRHHYPLAVLSSPQAVLSRKLLLRMYFGYLPPQLSAEPLGRLASRDGLIGSGLASGAITLLVGYDAEGLNPRCERLKLFEFHD
jgi:hypothetical protein